MPGTPRLTDAEVAEIRRRRPAMRASLACEGLYLPDEVEALFDQLEAERLPPDEAAGAHHRISSREAPREGARRRVKPHPLVTSDPTSWNRASIEGFYKLNHEPLYQVIAGALVERSRTE